jgi:uncharacterized protein
MAPRHGRRRRARALAMTAAGGAQWQAVTLRARVACSRRPPNSRRRSVIMAIEIYDQVVPVMQRMLKSLSGILEKAESYAQARKIEPAVLLQARLYPDMFALIRQIQIATDFTKATPARLAGLEVPSWEDNEQSFADLQARIARAQDFLSGFKREHFAGAETRQIEVKTRLRNLSFKGQDYLLSFALPNFYFHLATAYGILRHNGVEIGKVDFLGL